MSDEGYNSPWWSLFGSCDGRPFPDPGETNDRRAITYWAAEVSC